MVERTRRKRVELVLDKYLPKPRCQVRLWNLVCVDASKLVTL